MASLTAPPSKKNAAALSNFCFPSSENAFFKAALRQRSSEKLFLKNCAIFSSFTDLHTPQQSFKKHYVLRHD